MCVSPVRSLMSLVLALTLLNSFVPAHANESLNNQTTTLEKAVYFDTVQGDRIQLLPGTYELNPSSDSLQVNQAGENSDPLELAITMDTHEQDLDEPLAVSVPGLPDTDTSDRHVLALFLPGGLTYEAEGTYSGVRSRDVDPHTLLTDPMQVYFEKPIHFVTPNGEPLEVKPGTYTVEETEQGIRLVSPEQSEVGLLDAQSEKDDSSLDTSVALSLPGDAEDAADLHYVVLMTSGGDSFQALGTYSGVQSRGLFKKIGKSFKKTVKKAKRTVNRVGKKAKGSVKRVGKGAKRTVKQIGKGAQRTTKKIGKGLKKAGRDTGRFAKKAALDAKKKAEWVARQAAKGAQIAAKAVCKAGLTASRVAAEVQAKLLSPIKKALFKALQADKAQKALRQAVEKIKRQQAASIQQSFAAAMTLAHPKNTKTVRQLLSPNQMCERPAATVQKTMQKMIGKPLRAALASAQSADSSGVRSRGSFASASIGLGGNLAKVGGGEIGVRYAFDFINKSHWYLDLAGMLKTNVGGGGAVAIGIFPKKNPVDTGGWFMGAAVGFPLPKAPQAVGGGIDFFFDFPLQIKPPFKPRWNLTSWKFFVDHFQGFAVSVGAGKNASPVDIALKAGGGIRLSKK